MGSHGSNETASRAMRRLLLLRHGEVASHRGDVPVTPDGVEFARGVGRIIAETYRSVRMLTGETLRTRQTAEAIAQGAESRGANVTAPVIAHALRNPDIFVAGVRVDLVSTAEAVAAQIDGFEAEYVMDVPFFAGFLSTADRIKYWLHEKEAPGEDSAAVATRISRFASSLVDDPKAQGLTVAVTHSPILRACMMHCLDIDPGEPNWVSGICIDIAPDRSLTFALLPEVSASSLAGDDLQKASLQ